MNLFPTFVSSRKEKLLEYQFLVEFELPWQEISLVEIQSESIEEISKWKVTEAYKRFGFPVWTEDTGLYLKAWHNLPGPYIKWFIKNVGLNGICRMLDSFEDRGALAKTVITAYDGINYVEFVGVIEGKIPLQPRGGMGFGFDNIFQPEGSKRTFAEMSRRDKSDFSMRAKAFKAFLGYLAVNGWVKLNEFG